MSYVDFHHDGIEYRLITEFHYTTRNEPIEDLDALVIETGTTDQENIPAFITEERIPFWAAFPESIREAIRERDFRIYSVENRLQIPYLLAITNMSMHFFLPPFMTYSAAKLFGAEEETAQGIRGVTYNAQLVPILALLPLGISSRHLGPVSTAFSKLNSYCSFLRQSPIEEYRNAIAAKKIKEGVVPRLRKHVKEDRPLRIGIKYGILHTGIRECLESDARVSSTLALHKWYGRFLLGNTALNTIYEYNLNPTGIVRVEKFHCPVY